MRYGFGETLREHGLKGIQAGKVLKRTAGVLGSAAGVAFVAALFTMASVAIASANTTQTRVTEFEYDPVTGLLTKEIIQPDDLTLRLETTYTHDGFGNRLTTMVSAPGETPRESEVFYDGQGRFVEWAENALDHREWRDFDPRFGTGTKLTGPNGLDTTWNYDLFGRKIKETRADKTYTEFEYRYCDNVAGGSYPCPAGGAYVMISYLKDEFGAFVGSPTHTYYDTLERVIRKEEQGFNGVGAIAIYVDTEYDNLGRVHRVSEPYFAGATRVWTTNSYDVLGRLIGQTLPDASTITNAYNGLTGTSTNDKGQVRKETKNARGNVVKVEDDLNQITTYEYDPFDNLVKVTDAALNVTTTEYDDLGRRTKLIDPGLGTTEFTYNAFGELTSETDAKLQTTTYTYDVLGRMLTRTDHNGDVASWVYDTATKGIGKLTETSDDYGGYKRTHTYDSLGRLATTSVEIDEGDVLTPLVTGTFIFGYDLGSRLHTVQYPSPLNLTLEYLYNVCGHLIEVKNQTANKSIWEATALDARDQVVAEKFGNDVTSTRDYDVRGWLEDIGTKSAGSGTNDVQQLAYVYDTIGNVTERQDQVTSLTETFLYDDLNRLKSAHVTGQTAQTVTYDAIGNITYKSDVGTYTYTGAGGPHAVASITGTVNTSFTYDANGNTLTGNSRTLTWTTFDKPATITRGGSTLDFTYGTDRQRVTQKGPDDTTYYMATGGTAHLERIVDGTTGLSKYQVYISSSGRLVAAFSHVEQPSPTPAQEIMRYYHDDNLGSVSVITDDQGAVVERLSYDAWGERRDPATGVNNPAITSGANRGFTKHEHLEEVALVHMNGRVYDAQIARFLSADPHVQEPFNTQDLNRYTYVNNNPLAYTDPSGYFKFLKRAWKAVKKVVKAVAKAVKTIVRAIKNDPLKFALVVAASFIVGPQISAWAGGLVSSSVGTFAAGVFGKAVAGAAIGGFSAAVYGGSGSEILTAMAFGGLAGAATGAFDQWITTDWKAPVSGAETFNETNAVLTVSDVSNATTSWSEVVAKTFAEAGARAGIAKLAGRDVEQAFYQGVASSFSRSVYNAFVPTDPRGLGNISDQAADKYELSRNLNGEVVIVALNKNNTGNWIGIDGSRGFTTEGGAFSRALDGLVPGMRSTSYFHDVIAVMYRGSLCESSSCFATMLPSAAIAYGAIARDVPPGAFDMR